MSEFYSNDGEVDDGSTNSPSVEPAENIPRSTEYLLVETIRRVGVSNYSLIARLTGLNSETVRYKVNRQLSRMGLGVKVSLDYSNLGFSMSVLDVRARYHPNRTWADYCSYLTFVGKVMGSDRYLCIYALPHRFKKKYTDELTSLQTSGLIEQFESTDVMWARNPPFRSEFYDFDHSRWNIDWERVDTAEKEMGLTTLFPCKEDPKIDSIDVKIILSLQEDPTINPAKIAKQLGANPRTIRYHYLEHVVKAKLILGNNVRRVDPTSGDQQQQGNVMKVALSFKELQQEEANAMQKICNKIPFTWLELKVANGGYLALLEIPVQHFQDTVQYIEGKTEPLQKKLDFLILDSFKTQSLNIPYEMFDLERGWRLMPFLRKHGTEREEGSDGGEKKVLQESAPLSPGQRQGQGSMVVSQE
ncbi:MAG TPA: AsnC family protein [Nitrososphaerales archaeon]|nr:AsnC family protein [Nitrososphaerales archaeon]